MADVKLTKRQQQIFDFIRRHTSDKGYPPTVRDIGQAVDGFIDRLFAAGVLCPFRTETPADAPER